MHFTLQAAVGTAGLPSRKQNDRVCFRKIIRAAACQINGQTEMETETEWKQIEDKNMLSGRASPDKEKN